MHSGLRSAAAKGPTTPPRRPAEISAAAARCASVIALGAESAACAPGIGLTTPVWHERLARRLQGELQALARQAGDERADDPAETERDVARDRRRLALEIHAAVALLEPPVYRVEPPRIAAALPRRLQANPGGCRRRSASASRTCCDDPAARAARPPRGEPGWISHSRHTPPSPAPRSASRIEPPQVAATLARPVPALGAGAGVGHFGQTCAVDPAARAARPPWRW